jgi:hypothetical protein
MKTFNRLIQEELSHYHVMHKASLGHDTSFLTSAPQPTQGKTSAASFDALYSLLFDYNHLPVSNGL